ncbi:MAG: RCC1 domain-containing protein [Verrucomicrobiales bacterium]
MTPSGEVLGWGTSPAALVPSDLGPVKAIAAGGDLSLALLRDGRLRIWGTIQGSPPVPAPPGILASAVVANPYGAYALLVDGAGMIWESPEPEAISYGKETADALLPAGAAIAVRLEESGRWLIRPPRGAQPSNGGPGIGMGMGERLRDSRILLTKEFALVWKPDDSLSKKFPPLLTDPLQWRWSPYPPKRPHPGTGDGARQAGHRSRERIATLQGTWKKPMPSESRGRSMNPCSNSAHLLPGASQKCPAESRSGSKCRVSRRSDRGRSDRPRNQEHSAHRRPRNERNPPRSPPHLSLNPPEVRGNNGGKDEEILVAQYDRAYSPCRMNSPDGKNCWKPWR